ncbi:MAG TPA: hypothetical protein VFG69_02970 [Nannocystaceae bacterium]|nr:hypothetical protein [Nannocystaceae bacterium]
MSVLAASPFSACDDGSSARDDDDEVDAGKGDGFGNAEVVSTQNASVKLLGGYNELFDKTTSSCVVADGPATTAARLSVGQLHEQFGVYYLRSREDLAEKLGIDLSATAKLPVILDAHGTFSLLNSLQTSDTSVNLLLAIRQDYTVANRAEVHLGSAAEGWVAAGNTKQLVRTCGTHWVDGVRFGGYVYVLLGFHAATRDAAEKIAGDLGVNVGLSQVSFGVEFKASAEKAAQRDDVEVTLHAVSAGVSPRTTDFVAMLTDHGVTKTGLSVVDGIRDELSKSMANDRCRDSGEGLCEDGLIAPVDGYLGNTVRNAVPTGVQLGFYDALDNAIPDAAVVDPFETLAERSLAVRKYLRDYSELRERIARVYLGEVQAFLNAPAAVQSTFNAAAPAEPFTTVADLHDAATAWQGELAIGDRLGTRLRDVVDEIDACGSLAAVNIMTSCIDVDAHSTPAYVAAEQALADYAQSGRILPLRMLTGASVGASQASASCSALAKGYRLPNAGEAELMQPWLATQAAGTAFWVATDDAACPVAAYSRNVDGTAALGCGPAADKHTIVCVDAAGPVPKLPYAP